MLWLFVRLEAAAGDGGRGFGGLDLGENNAAFRERGVVRKVG